MFCSPFEGVLPQRHLLSTGDDLTYVDKIIIGVTCGFFGIVGIVGAVFLVINRKKVFSSVSPSKVDTIQTQVLEMHQQQPGPSSSSAAPVNLPPPEGASDEPPQYNDLPEKPTGGDTDVTVEAEVEQF